MRSANRSTRTQRIIHTAGDTDRRCEPLCRACVARAARLRQAQTEADKASQELKRQLESEFKAELASKDAGDSNFSTQLKQQVQRDQSSIEEGYNKNQQAVVDFLLHHVTTVKLEVSEALRQSLLTKAEQGTH